MRTYDEDETGPSKFKKSTTSARALQRVMAYHGLVEAAEIVLAQKIARHLRPKTIESVKGQIKALVNYFGDIPLNELTPEAFIAYQEHRSGRACADTVNHECAILKKILKKASVAHEGIRTTLWEPISEYYQPLTPKEWKPPKTFTLPEQARIFEAAAEDPGLELANIVFRITRNTTASGSELRGLKLGDLELNAKPPRIHIPRSCTKNDLRPRTIPLNPEAFEAMQEAVARAAKLGSYRDYHYIFPLRVNRALWNPLKPASSSWLRKQTVRLRKNTGINHIRPHAFRHLAVTELLESGVPEQTVIALAGWVGRNMLATYSHTRIEAKNEAVKVLNRTSPKQGVSSSSNLLSFPQR